jgi:hypothetical protein
MTQTHRRFIWHNSPSLEGLDHHNGLPVHGPAEIDAHTDTGDSACDSCAAWEMAWIDLGGEG